MTHDPHGYHRLALGLAVAVAAIFVVTIWVIAQ